MVLSTAFWDAFSAVSMVVFACMKKTPALKMVD
jgi:hypothetical protein